MTNNSAITDFKYKLPWYYQVLFTLVPISFLALGVMGAYAIDRVVTVQALYSKPAHLDPGFLYLLAVVAIHATMGAVLAFVAVREFLRIKRASIHLRDDMLEFIDWRGRSKVIRWQDVNQVVIPRAQLTGDAFVISKNGRHCIRYYFEDRNILIDEIISHANLEMTSAKWYQTVFARRRDGTYQESQHPT